MSAAVCAASLVPTIFGAELQSLFYWGCSGRAVVSQTWCAVCYACRVVLCCSAFLNNCMLRVLEP
jgi:hypothetical protein